MSLKIVKIEQLKEDYEQLKLLLTQPDLYIWNYFNDLKNDIDISFGTKLLEESREELNLAWVQMIDRVKEFEQECLAAHPNLDQYRTFLETIEAKYTDLMAFVEGGNEPKAKKIKSYTNPYKEAEERRIRLIDFDELVYDETIKLEQILFLNKTIIFINKEKWLELESENSRRRWLAFLESNIFREMNSNAVGKLLCISNQYFGKRCVKVIKNEIDDYELRFDVKLSNEIIKCKLLKETLEFKMTSKSIDEITLNFDQIKRIESYTNGLKQIDKNLFQDFTNIDFIQLRNNIIELIEQDTFYSLTRLKSLNLANNKISSLNPNLLDKSSSLLHLNLSENKIKKIPENFFMNATNLLDIALDKNYFLSIESDYFSGLKKLASIQIANNFIETINKNSLKDLINLRRFNMCRNRLISIEADIFQNCTYLVLINLASNRLTSIPANLFSKLVHLKNIDLSKNNLTDLDDRIFNGLPELTSIILKENKLTKITRNFFAGLSKLNRISMSKNNLKQIDNDAFVDLIRLAICDLGHNQIKTIQKNCFSNSKRIKRVILSGNELSNEMHTRFYLGLEFSVELF